MFSDIFHYILNLFRQDRPDRVVCGDPRTSSRMIEDMSKRELDALGRENGVNLDRRRKKEVLIAKLKEAGIYHG